MPTAAYSKVNLQYMWNCPTTKKGLFKIQITCTCHKLNDFNLVSAA